VVGVLVALYRGLVGSPTTPMTVARADRMFGAALLPGMPLGDVEAWLVSEGIPPDSGCVPPPYYEIVRRLVDADLKGRWLGGSGDHTFVELAGVGGDVSLVVRVVYPDAGRSLFAPTRITVYLFFDPKDRLIKHWVDEHILGL
jgi:hypothetical protein